MLQLLLWIGAGFVLTILVLFALVGVVAIQFILDLLKHVGIK
jgi:hypothetical protein